MRNACRQCAQRCYGRFSANLLIQIVMLSNLLVTRRRSMANSYHTNALLSRHLVYYLEIRKVQAHKVQ